MQYNLCNKLRKNMSNLFKEIFWRNFPKTKPEKLADDLGKMRGFVNIKQIDPITGALVRNHGQFNTLVNQSKSNLIRLISQGQSSWLGQIDPTQLKISKMRFGNNGSSGTPNTLLYYDINEPASRASTPTAGDLAGGLPGCATLPSEATSIVQNDVANVPGNYTVGVTSNLKIYTIRNGDAIGTALSDHSPSPGTFKVELRYSNATVETLYFYDTIDPTNILPYQKGGRYPYKIATLNGNVAANRIIAPNSRPTDDGGGIYSKIVAVGDNSQTFLYYDYTANCWKLQLEELAGVNTLYDTVRMSFERGRYNVINGIIPATGYNVGSGNTVALRYAYNQNDGDYYSVLSNLEYRDGDTEDVDDYSVTFSTIMSGAHGNGMITDMADYINYQEAFLFNERDDMFSALYLSTPFDKNQLTAYFISWTILAPL
jgi:hypothetical protein